MPFAAPGGGGGAWELLEGWPLGWPLGLGGGPVGGPLAWRAINLTQFTDTKHQFCHSSKSSFSYPKKGPWKLKWTIATDFSQKTTSDHYKNIFFIPRTTASSSYEDSLASDSPHQTICPVLLFFCLLGRTGCVGQKIACAQMA